VWSNGKRANSFEIALSLLSLHKLFIYAENKLKYL
jgi:hypothetical protein